MKDEKEDWGSKQTTDTGAALDAVEQIVKQEGEDKLAPVGGWRKHAMSARKLQGLVFPPIKWVVPDLLPEGLGMLAGRPKLGKSWMALEISQAVASGSRCLGNLEVQQGDVLYAACEDSNRRLHSRMTRLLGDDPWPARLTLTTQWSRLDKDGIKDILDWIKDQPEPRLIVLDTLASVKPQTQNSGYAEDYASLSQLHRVANDVGIGILVLHHQRKGEAEDPLDTISGTLGIAGCVDTPIILSSGSQGKTLYVRGRDIEEKNFAMEFNKEQCRWNILGEASDFLKSDTRARIMDTLANSTEAMTPHDIASVSGLTHDVVRQQLHRMVSGGDCEKEGRGRYYHPDFPPKGVTSVTTRKKSFRPKG